MMYQLIAKQKLATDMETAWAFLSNPENLETITPEMGFRILSKTGDTMFEGQIIQYKISLFKGIKADWVTEITHVKDNAYFTDEQRFGPYAFWHHKHFIRPVEGGVEMEDIVDYKLPLGILGRMMHSLYVKKKLKTIFKYRKEKLAQYFGKINEDNTLITIKKIN